MHSFFPWDLNHFRSIWNIKSNFTANGIGTANVEVPWVLMSFQTHQQHSHYFIYYCQSFSHWRITESKLYFKASCFQLSKTWLILLRKLSCSSALVISLSPEKAVKPLFLTEEVGVQDSLGLFESLSRCWLCSLEYAPWVLSDSP